MDHTYIVGDIIVISNHRMTNVVAKVLNIDHGDVLLCITDDGTTFSAHKSKVSLYIPARPVVEELPPAPAPVATVAEAPKHYSNTIKKKAAQGSQQSLF